MTREEFIQQRVELARLTADRDEFRKLNEHHKEQFLRVNLENARLRAALDWSGLRIDNPTLNWALKELGPTDTNAEAYVKAAVKHVIYMRDKAHAALKEGG